MMAATKNGATNRVGVPRGENNVSQVNIKPANAKNGSSGSLPEALKVV
jgi:hypothetical protein